MTCEKVKLLLDLSTLQGLSPKELLRRGEHGSVIKGTNRYELCDGSVIETTPTGLKLAMAWRCRVCEKSSG